MTTSPVAPQATAPPRPPEPGPARDSQPRRRRRPDLLAIGLFLLPALVLFVLLVLTPIAVAVYFSLYSWNGLGPVENFIGLENFTRAFGDPVFRGDLWRGFVLIVLSLVIQLPAALGLAMLLNQRLPGRAVFRVIFFVPYVISEAITAVLFARVFSPTQGLAVRVLDWANGPLGWVGLGPYTSDWLGDTSTVLIWVFMVVTWKYFGFHMILYLAGRQGIPEELIEAAAIDGAGAWQTFRRITLPLLGPTIRVSVFLSVIGALQLFDMVWVLTQGGPAHASETMAVTMFQHGFQRYEVGYASAISVVMFAISLVFALSYQRFVMRRDLGGAITPKYVGVLRRRG